MLPDLLIGIINLILGFSLIPQLYHGFKFKTGTIKISTSLLGGIGMYCLAWIYIVNLKLYFTGIVNLLFGSLWLILLYQTLKYKL